MKKPLRFLGKTLLFLFLAAIVSSVIVASVFINYAKTIDATLNIDELFSEQGLTTKIYALNSLGASIELESQRLYGAENRIFVSIDDIPQHVVDAFIAIEDHRFWHHGGFDIYRTLGAVINFITPSAQSYGGSTITQQLIKNLTGENQITVKRKLTELLRATDIEKKYSKREIIEMYLNTVYLSQGCYGIETAAEKYFGKKATELTIAEGASLAAIIRYPTRYDPIANPENNIERRNVILARMNELGYLSDELYNVEKDAELGLKITLQKKSAAKNTWFTDCLIEQVIDDLCREKGLSRTVAANLLYGGGLTIYTTQNIEMQSMLSEYYTNVSNIPSNTSGVSAQSAAVIMDKSGGVLAIVGGKGEKRQDRSLCLATGMLRTPGSVIKPVSVYAPAIDKQIITWASVFDDVPVSFVESDGGLVGWPKNNPRVYSGLVNVNQAIKTSINTVSVKVLEKLGYRTSFDFLRDTVGITTLVESRSATGGVVSDVAPAPLALGALSDGASLLEMTGAYTMFANGGYVSTPHFYTAVYNKNGELLLSCDGNAREAISPDTAEIMTRLMQQVLTPGGTASCITLKNRTDVAGKTGTSNANTDRWFIGYTPDLICGVWYGYKDARDLGSFTANPAALIFDGVMTRVTAMLDSPKTKFDHSENVIQCTFCKDSGMLETSVCSLDPRGKRNEVGYFIKGTEPTLSCSTHVEVDICESGGVSLGNCREHTHKAALIKVNRSFPTQVKITDAQYVYKTLPFGMEPSYDESTAFFDSLRRENEFFGTSGVAKAYNRACRHFNTRYDIFDFFFRRRGVDGKDPVADSG
ncbi:MAG: transglycosylase domain-containing protein [Clostridia bacterium]|nr:transglycosylase domain-containing protein [Clostridia bacterium]